MNEDQRRFPRESCLISAHLRLGKRLYEGTLLNVCEDGAFIATPAPLDEDTALELRFRHPRTDETVKARAVVARRIRPGQGRVGIGVKLIDDLSSLESAAGAQASSTGTWSRPELVSDSGSWGQTQRKKEVISGTVPAVGEPESDRRLAGARVAGQRLQARHQAPGELPGSCTVLDLGEGGSTLASDRLPKVGRLVRIDLDSHLGGRAPGVSLTGRVTWRREEGSPSFGLQILHFGGSEHRIRFAELLAWARRNG